MRRTMYFGAALFVAVAIAVGIVYATEIIYDDLVVTGDLGVQGDLVSLPNANVSIGGDVGLGSSDAHINFTGSSGRVEFQNEGHIIFDAEDSGLGFGEFGGANFGNGGLLMFFKPAELGLDAQSPQVSIAALASAFGAQLDSEDPPELRAFIYASAEAPGDLPIGGTDYMVLNVCNGAALNIADTGTLALGDFTLETSLDPPTYSGAFLIASSEFLGTTLAAFNASTTGGGASETAPYASMQAMNSDGTLVGLVKADESGTTLQSLEPTETPGESNVRTAITATPAVTGENPVPPVIVMEARATDGTPQASVKVFAAGESETTGKVRLGNSIGSGLMVLPNGDVVIELGD